MMSKVCKCLLFVVLTSMTQAFARDRVEETNNHYTAPEELDVTAVPSRSLEPTIAPTTQSPTGLPSQNPTAEPTLHPSVNPSNEPSGLPTISPSETHSFSPSSKPSMAPSLAPSWVPSSVPSSFEFSSAPTFLHSKTSSSEPTFAPTVDDTPEMTAPVPEPEGSREGDDSFNPEGMGVGVITALGVAGFALFVTAAIVQWKRVKLPVEPEVVTTFSEDV